MLKECFCGTSIATQQMSEGNCTMVCKGDTTQFCGAGSRLSLWSINQTSVSTSSKSSAASSTTTLSKSSAASPTTTLSKSSAVSSTTTAASTPTVNGSKYVSCISETNPRALDSDSNSVSTQTLELCAQRAADKNFRYFGLEYSSECYLADVINPASVRLDESKCSMPCSGNQKQLCGGSMAISLFNNTRYTPRIPLAIQTSSGRNFTYQGCFSDQGNPRTLGAYSISQGSNTVEACAQLCSSKGYSWAGVEYGAECYCGNAGTGAASLKSDTECSKPCAGNAKQNCGGGFALQVYRQNTA